MGCELRFVSPCASARSRLRARLCGRHEPATDGRVAFHARVAQNVLAIVEREIALRPQLEAAQREAATRLGYEGEAALADAIKNGHLDTRQHEVLALLRNVVDVRVAIANPKHVG